ncbi:hypothetical protein JCM19241_5042 [Vibrio ishigakensis]|uniref:Uncharacterized protein n=1 Tax=Vibrio ishigakensis TaxID=1481914 RepID=A0A0B8Q5P3_9VIBR|nr:hypothetical protein JCM19241_5042 [Vibrio ishigakensis]
MKILFIEPKHYFKNILDDKLVESEDAEFEGYRYYKKESGFFCNYDLVVSIQYLFGICNVVLFKARQVGIPTVLITDGIIDWNNNNQHPKVILNKNPLFSNMTAEYLACPGEFESKFFGGHKSFQFLPKRAIPSNMHNNTTIESKVVKNSNSFVVMITTANTAYFNDAEKSRLLDLIKLTIDKFNDHENVTIYTRIFDQSLVADLGEYNLENVTSNSFEEACEQADVIITTPSSISLTAMLMNKPVAQLIYRDAPLLLQSGWNIHQSCDFDSMCESILSKDAERMRYQSEMVKLNYNHNTDFLKQITKLTTESEKCDNFTPPRDINKYLMQTLESPYNINLEFGLRRLQRSLVQKIKFLKSKLLFSKV